MDMPETQQSNPTPGAAESFVADRQIFWSRFTTFATGAVVVVVVVLIGLWLFVA